MGNCASLGASLGEERRSAEAAVAVATAAKAKAGEDRRSREAAPPPETLVKIKIGRRQLEALQRTAGSGALPLHLVLAHLLPGAGRDELLRRARQWRPALHSISEVGD
ncbi:unnamed protein product [Spirodela intermedia]|uniref:Uncharacterized protein n=1 Tax=Spirodela intermedia TaxID=51605 RepID=A0A7I8JP48_SPIIN|nr:unnamed protein product [Spirodela intermedia]CAA6671948.1 unnamed protein product [Spirodela intermedia]